MLTNIDKWCYDLKPQRKIFFLPPSIISMLLNDENNTVVKFINAVKNEINRIPKYLDISFDAPPFPFDHTEFEDPFCLVEDISHESVDLEGLRKLKDKELEGYLKDLYTKFTYSNNGNFKIKKKELLNYVSRNWFLEISRKEGIKRETNKSL